MADGFRRTRPRRSLDSGSPVSCSGKKCMLVYPFRCKPAGRQLCTADHSYAESKLPGPSWEAGPLLVLLQAEGGFGGHRFGKSLGLAHFPIRLTNPTGLRKFRNTEFTLGQKI